MPLKAKYLLVSIALVVSLLIYHFYRVDHTLVNMIWTGTLGSSAHNTLLVLPDWVVYNLPETLWVFSATVLSYDVSTLQKRSLVMMYVSPFLVAVGIELFQLIHLTDGVYDIYDLLAATVGLVIGLAVSFQSPRLALPPYLSYGLVISSYSILILADVLV